MNKTDLQVLNLVGPTVTRPEQDPLAVTRLEKRLFVFNKKIL